MKPTTQKGPGVLSGETKLFTGATFKNSLRRWQSRYRAEKAAQATPNSPSTGGLGSSPQG